jgi:hypothetical protein
MLDLYLILIYAFLYILNSYGLGPTAQNYSESLGIPKEYTAYV